MSDKVHAKSSAIRVEASGSFILKQNIFLHGSTTFEVADKRHSLLHAVATIC